MPQALQNTGIQFQAEIKKHTGMTIAIGIIVLLIGIFAIGSPLITGLSLAVIIGVLLVTGGIAQLVFANKTGKGVLTIILGILTVIIGANMLSSPGFALESLTIFLAAYLLVSGIFEAVFAFQVRPVEGRDWALSSGVVSLLLGVMMWSQFPLYGAWATGTLIGLRLIFSGWTSLMFGLVARRAVSGLQFSTGPYVS